MKSANAFTLLESSQPLQIKAVLLSSGTVAVSEHHLLKHLLLAAILRPIAMDKTK